jgi:hypothetical protein
LCWLDIQLQELFNDVKLFWDEFFVSSMGQGARRGVVVVFSVLDLSSPKIICNLLAGGN